MSDVPSVITKFIRFTHKAIIYPIDIGYYIVTAGDPIYPEWMIKLDRYLQNLGDRLEKK